MKRALIVIAIAGCVVTPRSRVGVAYEVETANARELAKMMHVPIGYGGLWFDDATCDREFVAPGEIGADRIAEFARCVAGLHLTASKREHPFPDEMILDYGPGFEVEAEFKIRHEEATLFWLGYSGRHYLGDALPVITPEALEALRISGSIHPALSDADGARLARERKDLGLESSYAWLKVCIDGDGSVTGAHPREESSPIAGDVFSAAAMQWKFRPFVVGGRALPVCALVSMSEPEGDPPRRMPFPIPLEIGSVIVSPVALHRRVGDPQVFPDEGDALEMYKSGGGLFFAAFAYCVDERGDVTTARQLVFTGFPRYDTKLARAVLGWKYRPYVVEGKAIPACAAITFVYFSRS